jgi:dihydrofolate reductase
MNFILISAMSQNHVIGHNNRLPWKLPEDLAHFKKTTLGHSVLMGRKTYESLGRLLPGRRNWILSSDSEFQAEGAQVIRNLKDLDSQTQPMFVIGGEQVYRLTLPLSQKVILTCIERDFEGDAFFPYTEMLALFKETHSTAQIFSPTSGLSFRIVTYERRNL